MRNIKESKIKKSKAKKQKVKRCASAPNRSRAAGHDCAGATFDLVEKYEKALFFESINQ